MVAEPGPLRVQRDHERARLLQILQDPSPPGSPVSRPASSPLTRSSADPVAVSRNASATAIQNCCGSRSSRWTGTQAARSARPAAPIQDRSKNVFPLPGGADTWVTRAARPSRSNNSRRKTIPPLTAGPEPPTLPDGRAGSMALTVSLRSPHRNGRVCGTRTSRT